MTGSLIIAGPGAARLITPEASAAQATDMVGEIRNAGTLLTQAHGRRMEIAE